MSPCFSMSGLSFAAPQWIHIYKNDINIRHVRTHCDASLASLNSVSLVMQIFTARETSQLDIYGIWSITRNQLYTDDTFTFNRTIKGIKESILHLPDATEGQEEALQAVKVRQFAFVKCCMAHACLASTAKTHTLAYAAGVVCPFLVCMKLALSTV